MRNLLQTPRLVAEDGKPHGHRDRSHGDLHQDRHRERGPRPARHQPGFDFLLEGIDIVLELARKKLPDLGIDAVDVGDQSKKANQQQQRRSDGVVHCARLREAELEEASLRELRGRSLRTPRFKIFDVLYRSINPTGNPNCLRKRSSRRAIVPLSVS